MKTALLIIVLFINSFISPIFAQTEKEKVFGKISLINGLFIPADNKVKNLNITFPYSLPDATGKFVASQFNKTVKKPFSPTLDCVGFSMEMGARNYFFSFEVDASPVFTPKGMYQVMTGYGHYWAITSSGLSNNLDSKCLFILSASVSFAVLNRKQFLGAINNNKDTLMAFNKAIEPNYTGGAFENDNNDYVAKEMDILLRQTACGLVPHISISTTTKICMELDFSYFLPFSESAAVNIYKHDDEGILGDGYSFAAKSKLNQNGVVIKTDDVIATNAPFNLGNFQIKLKIGVWDHSRSMKH